MRIAYILDEDISQENGVVKKIKSQILEWNKYNIEVIVISLRSESYLSTLNNYHIISLYDNKITFLNKFLNHYNNIDSLNKVLKKYSIDLIYTRYIRYSPNLLKVLSKHAPYIVEINTNDVEEFKLGSRLGYWLNSFTRSIFLKNALSFVSVSNELKDNKFFKKFKKETIVIGNGYNIDCRYIVDKEVKSPIKYVFIGSPNQPWHGIDKILLLADKIHESEFHIIGYSKKELLNINKKISNNVIAYGYVSQKESDGILKLCDIGISTLALHRNNMFEASPLKSRHYLSHGLAIIMGYKDTDLNNEKYLLNIGNHENNIVDNLNSIKEFENKLHSFSKISICEKSKGQISYKFKEKKRIDFFYKVLEKKN